MLKQRIITALLMLAVLLPALFYPNPAPFAAVAVVLVAAGAWEWANLNQCRPGTALAIAAVFAALCSMVWFFDWTRADFFYLWLFSGSAWVLAGGWLLRGGVPVWSKVPQSVRLLSGLAALAVAWLAVVKGRSMGINFLVSALVLVWIADVFAYFAGRALGGRFIKRKLAPSISPGKTWEGAIGGLLGVVVGALAWRAVDAAAGVSDLSIFSRLGSHGTFYLVLCVCFLAVMSVVGDLTESLFKRSAGAKDSSGLLPGHGGVLDRLDALLPTLPLAMLLTSL